MTHEKVEAIFKQIDVGGNGYVEYTEFSKAAICENILLKGENIQAAFNHFSENDGEGITK